MAFLSRPSSLAVTGLVAGFAVARYTGKRPLGGAVFVLAGAASTKKWAAEVGPAKTAGLVALYAAAMGGSHPLAKKIGAWPSVLAVSSVVAAASELAAR